MPGTDFNEYQSVPLTKPYTHSVHFYVYVTILAEFLLDAREVHAL